ncbi:MAG: hypothetical protein V3S53_08495, partial [Gammaproteobacteria bacterium]
QDQTLQFKGFVAKELPKDPSQLHLTWVTHRQNCIRKSDASAHTSYLILLLKNGPAALSGQTDNYT